MRMSDWSSDVCSSDLDFLDRAADPFDHQLHDAEIIEDRDQRGEENEHRKRGDLEAVRAHFGRSERAEDEIGASLGIAEQDDRTSVCVGTEWVRPCRYRLSPYT